MYGPKIDVLNQKYAIGTLTVVRIIWFSTLKVTENIIPQTSEEILKKITIADMEIDESQNPEH